MHDLGSTVCTQASLCGCTRPERANPVSGHLPGLEALGRVVAPGMASCISCERGG